MEDNFEKGLKAFFAERTPPPAEIKAAIAQKLAAAEKEAENRQTLGRCLLILLFAALMSAAMLGVLWALLGTGIITLAASAHLFATITGGLAITLALKDKKGGNPNAVSVD
jgi:hypothetical protein